MGMVAVAMPIALVPVVRVVVEEVGGMLLISTLTLRDSDPPPFKEFPLEFPDVSLGTLRALR